MELPEAKFVPLAIIEPADVKEPTGAINETGPANVPAPAPELLRSAVPTIVLTDCEVDISRTDPPDPEADDVLIVS